jgi:uncharacterized protein
MGTPLALGLDLSACRRILGGPLSRRSMMAERSEAAPTQFPTDDTIRDILNRYKTIAVVGLSRHPEKPSHFVPKYLKDQGYKVIPVNPSVKEDLLGEKVYGSLSEIPRPVEIVDIFRPTADVPEIVKEGISIGAKVIWMQEGILHEEAARHATEAGLIVVMNRCMMKDHRRLKGTLLNG